MNDPPANSRREFLTGRALRAERNPADQGAARVTRRAPPAAGATIRLGKPAMACDFDVILNPGDEHQLAVASDVLDLVDRLEDQMTVYRANSEMSRLNAAAASDFVQVEARLYALLRQAERLSRETERAFDPTAGPLVALWRRCQREGRLPGETEIAAALECVGIDLVEFHDAGPAVRYRRPGVELNLGSIGKGHALDRAAELLEQEGVHNWLLHGGHSSLLARGTHAGRPGWPIGIRNPLFPERRLATVLLRDRGMSTSGSGVQFFRHQGKRYGHLLDPRGGWPVEHLMSVTVLAPTAAEADALSTAFFVFGVEKSIEYCHNHTEIAALIIPPPVQGRRLDPINCGIPDEDLFFAWDELSLVEPSQGGDPLRADG